MIEDILKEISILGGRGYFIGGCVRDEILGLENKDIDVEVYNLDIDSLISILQSFGKVDCVGKSFGVIKLSTEENDYDFSIPRRENKIGVGHKAFKIEVDSSMSLEEAAKRRDFTFNALSKDIEGNIIDPFGGKNDLLNGVLKHTSEQFGEDPLRVLRGFQFCGRFNLIADISTIRLCRGLKVEFSSISKDRLWTEFEKWSNKSVNPKAGLDFLSMCGWIELFPELRNILGCPQDLEWHNEGCVYSHTGWVCNAMNDICKRENISGKRKTILMMAALCHDLGKAETTIYRKGRISAPNHDFVGGKLAESFLRSIKCPNEIIKMVIPLVVNHMCHIDSNGSDKFVRKVSVKIEPSNIEDLVLLIEADHSGRPPKEKNCPEKANQLRSRARELGVNLKKPNKIVNGKDLLFCVPESQDMGNLVSWLYDKQIEGKFFDLVSGVKYAEHHHIFQKYRKLNDSCRNA
jgi:tRNA nucleotidyltransferase (CCA-adding enzyme)